jgi:type II secretory pathway component PulK
MIIVALVATLASSMLWQQWRAVQVEAAERARTQSAWVLSGALDWARLILREDAKTGGTDHLGEPWAVPLAEARLSTFLAADKDNTEDAPDAFLSGSITDANARYNLTNVVKGGKIDPIELAALQRLCETVGLSVDVAARISAGLRGRPRRRRRPTRARAAPARSRPRRPRRTRPSCPAPRHSWAWLGIEPGAVQALEPYVVILPETTFITSTPRHAKLLVAAVEGSTWPRPKHRPVAPAGADQDPRRPCRRWRRRCARELRPDRVRLQFLRGPRPAAPRGHRSRAALAGAAAWGAGAGAAAGAGLRARRHGLVSRCKSEQQYCEDATTEQRKSLIAGVFGLSAF